jgi:hypothetical protein
MGQRFDGVEVDHVTCFCRSYCWKSRLQLKGSNHKESYEGIQATYMGLLVRRAMKPVLGPISCLRLPGTIQHIPY